MTVQVFFMLGLPGESPESVRWTVEFAKRCGADDVTLGLYRPYPGTAVWDHPDKFGCRVVRGPSFEAYVEMETLTREGIVERGRWAGDELAACGVMKGDVLRWDRYEWEDAG